MNRYRTIPSLGQPKASATTTCQKCLKKDSYECKSTAQERPYIPRPSRTQQLLNPKMKPKLASEQGNGLMRTQGIADEELARTQAARESVANAATLRRSRSPDPHTKSSKRGRSASISSNDSVSTISTSRSRSPHPSRRMSPNPSRREQPPDSQSHTAPRPRKRKSRESSLSRSPPRNETSHKSRRYRSGSPEDRGRPAEDRRGSNRSRSRGLSTDRGEITKQRRSMEDQVRHFDGRDFEDRSGRKHQPEQYNNQQNRPPRPARKERSLSPYSRRLALTQAMNMGR